MAIKLFSATDTIFNSNGLGFIDALRCIETKKISLNGWSVEVDVNSNYMGVIKKDCILFIDTKEKGGQPFRINDVQNLGNQLRIKANHVCFDAEDYMLVDVRPKNANPTTFLDYINKRTDKPSPFITSSNVSGNATAYFIRKSLLEGLQKSEELFGGYFDFDGFNIQLSNQVGNDEGYAVAYGKNLQGISVIESWSGVCTRLYPVGPNALTLGDTYLESEQQYDKPYTRTVTFDIPTSYQDDAGTDIPYTEAEQKAMLREKAVDYLDENQFPKINYTVKSDVEQSLRIGDLVRIKHPSVMIKASVQAYTYDVLARRVKTLEFGNYMRDVKKVFDEIKDKVEQAQGAAKDAAWIVEKQTDLINNLNKNGFVYIDENEILILDKLPKEAASNVWRFGMGGIGFSKNGYQGPFEYAFTQDGTFNANFISAGSLQVDQLHSSVGSSLNILSNQAITQIVSNSERTEERLVGVIESTVELDNQISNVNAKVTDIENDFSNMIDDNVITNVERQELNNQWSALQEDFNLFVELLCTIFPSTTENQYGAKTTYDYRALYEIKEELAAFLAPYLVFNGNQSIDGFQLSSLLRRYEKEFNRCSGMVQAIIRNEGLETIDRVNTVTTQVEVLSDRFSVSIENIEQLGQFKESVESNMDFTSDGLIISKRHKNDQGEWVNGRFWSKFNEQELAFYDNNTKVTYLNNETLNVTNLKVTTAFEIGTIAWVPDANGSSSLKKVS